MSTRTIFHCFNQKHTDSAISSLKIYHALNTNLALNKTESKILSLKNYPPVAL